MVSALTYTVLRNMLHDNMTDPAFVQEALRLEQKGIVRCRPTPTGTAIRFSPEGVDAWVRTQLNREGVIWMPVEPCVYGILNPHKEPEKCLIDNRITLKYAFETLWIQTDKPLSFHAPKDLIVHFADLFCERMKIKSILGRLFNSK